MLPPKMAVLGGGASKKNHFYPNVIHNNVFYSQQNSHNFLILGDDIDMEISVVKMR